MRRIFEDSLVSVINKVSFINFEIANFLQLFMTPEIYLYDI